MKILIKDTYHHYTKQILKKLSSYNYVETFTINIMLKEDSPFNSFYFKLKWIDPKNDFEKKEIDISPSPFWIRDKVISEIIESLNLADKEIVFTTDTYY